MVRGFFLFFKFFIFLQQLLNLFEFLFIKYAAIVFYLGFIDRYGIVVLYLCIEFGKGIVQVPLFFEVEIFTKIEFTQFVIQTIKDIFIDLLLRFFFTRSLRLGQRIFDIVKFYLLLFERIGIESLLGCFFHLRFGTFYFLFYACKQFDELRR